MTFSLATVVQRLRSLPKPLPGAAELFFRCISFAHAKTAAANVITGQYSGLSGGRCNPPDGAPVCYLAGSQTNSMFEVEQEQLLLGIRPLNPPPKLIVAVTVHDAVVLDLCNPMIRQTLGLTSDQSDVFMPSDAWKKLNRNGELAPLQQVGAAARTAGFDGVRYPAILSQYIGQRLPALYNLALFMAPDSPHDPERASVHVQLHDDGSLGMAAGGSSRPPDPLVAVGANGH